jgi:hypothetical protein
MDQQANLADRCCQPSNEDYLEGTLAHENREPISSSTITPAWISRARLQCKMAWTAQHIGQLYMTNANPTALKEAIAKAREAQIKFQCALWLKKAGLNNGKPCDLTDEESDHNHFMGANTIGILDKWKVS